MKIKLAAGLLLAFLLVLTACTADDTKPESAEPVSSTAQSLPESSLPDDGSSAVTGAKPPSFARNADTETAYTQQTADGTEGAVITFFGDGTFEFKPVFYDGSPSVTGTYETADSAYVLTVQETTAQNINVEELGEIRFQFDGDNLVYQGTTIGETSDGAVFAS